jgi:hypothetical protein
MSGTTSNQRRAAIACRALPATRRKAPALRRRRGLLLQVKLDWRRCALGSNAITNHGVWRTGARRMAQRLNRSGETRWHRPRRLAAIFLPGAAA